MTITTDPAETNPIMSEQIKREYQIVKRLGRGGMGDVYLAEQLRVGRRLVALKVLNRACADNPDVVKRFEAEAATAGLIQHRNVVTIYESRVTDDGQIYVAMEFVAGRTLREVLAERQRLPLGEIVEIARQVCAGMAAAHKLGIVHRDIKPDNIMLVEEEGGSKTVKLLDFGIARLSESQSSNIHTKPGLIIGTPAYMSPEQAAGAIGDQIDSRSDIYSLAIVVYEMLTGRLIFEDESWMAVLRHHLYDPPSPPSRFCEAEYISPAVDRVILRALSKDRSDRPRSATDFARELEEAYRQAESSVGAVTTRNPRVVIDLADSEVAPLNAETTKLPSTPLVPRPEMASGNKGSDYTDRGKLRLLLIALIACVLLGWAGWTLRKMNAGAPEPPRPSPAPIATTPPVALRDLLYYRVRLDRPGGLIMPPNLTVRSGDSIFFQFKLTQPGALYLLEELKDGSWRWFNAITSGQQPVFPAGKWVGLPRGQYYELNDEVGEERFRVIYVPEHLRWSLAEAVAPSQIGISAEKKSEGSALIEPEAVRRALARLNAEGVELGAEGSRTGNAIEFRLRQPGEELRVAHYRITLNHIARE
ncbi:MAG: protein kinase domain-containing protein [Blastocatellia bacterium]